MQQASQVLLGLNDFTAFCRPREHGTSIRDLQEFSWHRREDGIIAARVRADAFCYSMVRMMVGAVLDIGAGRKPAQWLRGYLEGRTRDSSVFVAPAHGLTLTSVEYPPDDQLALRVERTRRRRIAGDPDS